MCTAWPPRAITGKMSLRTLLPTIRNRLGSTPKRRSRPVVGLDVLLEHDLEVIEVVRQAAGRDLVGLVHADRPW